MRDIIGEIKQVIQQAMFLWSIPLHNNKFLKKAQIVFYLYERSQSISREYMSYCYHYERIVCSFVLRLFTLGVLQGVFKWNV